MKRFLSGFLSLSLLAALSLTSATAQEAEVDKSDNVTLVKQIKYTGGTELASRGRFLYAGEFNGRDNRNQSPKKGGIRIFKLSDSGVPTQVGLLKCPGNDNDVEVLRPGVVLLGFSQNKCAIEAGNGFMTIDVSNPKKPQRLG